MQRDPDIDRLIDAPTFIVNPYPVYERLRASNPVHRGTAGPWLVSRHRDVVQILGDHQHFASDRRATGPTHAPTGPNSLEHVLGQSMMNQDPPVHTRLRSLTNRVLTPRRLELRPRVDDLVSMLVDEVRARDEDWDLINDFADPLAIMVMCDLLGVPADDLPYVRQLVRTMAKAGSMARAVGCLKPSEEQAVDAAADDLTQFMADLAARRLRRPEQDLVSDLAGVLADDDDTLVGTCVMLLIAGHQTTVDLIGNGMLALLRNPAQWAALKRDPTLTGPAVDEVLRYDSPTQMVARTVAADFELCGTRLRRGELVLALTGSANRDPERFARPDEVDIARSDRRHMSFGVAPHFCLGAPLARHEAARALRVLADRFPAIELAPGPLSWRPWRATATPAGLSFGLRGLEELRVRVPNTRL